MNKLSEDLEEMSKDYSFISGSWLQQVADEAKRLELQIKAMRNCENCSHDEYGANDFNDFCEMCGHEYKNWKYIKQDD